MILLEEALTDDLLDSSLLGTARSSPFIIPSQHDDLLAHFSRLATISATIFLIRSATPNRAKSCPSSAKSGVLS